MKCAPRVVVDVASSDEGWLVTVSRAGGAVLVPPYAMAVHEVDGQRVPGTPSSRTPEGAAPHVELCRGDVAALSALLGRVRHLTLAPGDVATYGRWLFECLLAPAWRAVRDDPDVAAARSVELAFRWPVAENDLHRLVWEAVRDERAPLAGHPDLLVALSRLVPGEPVETETVVDVPRVLFASGAPLVDETIRPGAMYMGLLRSLEARGRCRAVPLQNATADGLANACRRFAPHVVHLVAHGVRLDDGRGALMLRNDSGGDSETDAAGLVSAVTAGGRPHAVVLSACNTAAEEADPGQAGALAAQLVRAGVPVVVAMSGEVSEPACRQYTRRLAEGVYQGWPVVVASAHGRRAALVNAPNPGSEIDWALPALFLNEHLDPEHALVNPDRAEQLIGLAGDLGMRREPVFIGRTEALTVTDQLTEPGGGGCGVVALLATGNTSGLGGTRLLHEVGWRLIRAGHVPVMLGPFAPGKAPVTALALVELFLREILSVSEKFGLTPWVPAALADLATVDIPADASPAQARSAIRKAIARLAPVELDPESVRDLLADDLMRLASEVSAWGLPFGPHTRAVVLLDDVHEWASAAGDPDDGALQFLLSMLQPAGLGDSHRQVPVVLTGSRASGGGPLAAFAQSAAPGIRVLPLEELEAAEAVLGYQWVLLHPWTTRLDERFASVYTAGPKAVESWELGLGSVSRRPVAVQDNLYAVAAAYAAGRIVRQDDDEKAWREYATRFPEYGL